jgi:hypothetical protein
MSVDEELISKGTHLAPALKSTVRYYYPIEIQIGSTKAAAMEAHSWTVVESIESQS